MFKLTLTHFLFLFQTSFSIWHLIIIRKNFALCKAVAKVVVVSLNFLLFHLTFYLPNNETIYNVFETPHSKLPLLLTLIAIAAISLSLDLTFWTRWSHQIRINHYYFTRNSFYFHCNFYSNLPVRVIFDIRLYCG